MYAKRGMFRRREGDQFVLVTQVAHARLAAVLAEHVGNRRWATPQPREGTLMGIEMHDAGWPMHDEAATINPDGLPTHAFEMRWQTVLPIWAESTRRAAAADPYAGLLVSLHGLALSAFMFKQDAHRPAHQTFAINKFQHEQIEIQELLRRRLSMRTDGALSLGLAPRGRSIEEDWLLFNFRLLQMTDQLSVNICFDELKLPVLENVYMQPGKARNSLKVSRGRAGEFGVEPWPFDAEELRLELAVCRVKAKVYESDAELRGAIAAAGKETVKITMRRKGRFSG